MLKEKLDQDIKAALLAGNKPEAEVLRSLKSAILYEEVAQKVRETGLDDAAIQKVFAREAKKRTESAEMYQKANENERAQKELDEKAIIERYLPQQLSDEELGKIVETAIGAAGPNAQLGQVIGMVKAQVGQSADGARIAAVVKAKLEGKEG
ncbi:MAG: GatB/YqeY domain-containing protein [Candidatus Saccharimonadales bacterium]